MKSDVIIHEVILKMTNQEARVCLVVEEMTCDLVKEGIGESVVVLGVDMYRALGFHKQQKSI